MCCVAITELGNKMIETAVDQINTERFCSMQVSFFFMTK